MLTIEKTVLPSPEQWEIVIEGMRNPMNSWDKSDSGVKAWEIQDGYTDEYFALGDADLKLMKQLAKGGPVHAKYRRMLPVFLTINAPLYWWKEFDTYKVGTVCNSCSTMHKIHANEFTLNDFSHEHIDDGTVAERVLNDTVRALNDYRSYYLTAKEKKLPALMKRYWWHMIQLLPSSYNQKRTVLLNYEVLVNIYHSRKNHKLDEWHVFCDWIKTLPYSELITGGDIDV